MRKLLILTSDYCSARNLAWDAGYHYSEVEYIHHPDKLRGLCKGILYALGDWEDNGRADDIMQRARIQGMRIEFSLPQRPIA